MNPSDDSAFKPVISEPEDPLAGSSSSTLPVMPLPMPESPINPQPAFTPGVQSMTLQVADDKDLIEPEWVNKAKNIMMSNREDPYTQSDELTAFKADYMQKRYNKIIKLK